MAMATATSIAGIIHYALHVYPPFPRIHAHSDTVSLLPLPSRFPAYVSESRKRFL